MDRDLDHMVRAAGHWLNTAQPMTGRVLTFLHGNLLPFQVTVGFWQLLPLSR